MSRKILLMASFLCLTLVSSSYAGAVIAAYQEPYAMNFEVWKPQDLPAGWYATFDGFPVAQIDENRWVYGRLNIDGAISPTDILVGSVIPSNVPELARTVPTWTYGLAFDSPEFMRIKNQMCNRMGWLYFPESEVNTVTAWHTQRVGVWIWLGNRWRRFEPHGGEMTWQMIKRLLPYIARELKKHKVWYLGGEPVEAADFARQWGMIWGGRVIIEKLKSNMDHGNDGGTVTSMRESSSSSSSGPKENTPATNTRQDWDVE